MPTASGNLEDEKLPATRRVGPVPVLSSYHFTIISAASGVV
jgi:hypothetical protein